MKTYYLFVCFIQIVRASNITVEPDTRIFLPPYDFTSVNILLVYGPAQNDCDSYFLHESIGIIQNDHFDINRSTVLYMHGYLENMESESIRVIIDAYIQRNDHNILILDWSKISEGNYIFKAVPGMFALSSIVSDCLLHLLQNGLPASKLHLVGHSLGAQLAGLVSSNLHTSSKKYFKLKRLTGLDPAFPLFILPNIYPINQFEAHFVDIIHTDAGIFGEPVMTGGVDFWPNGGRPVQPGCPIKPSNNVTIDDVQFCSHRRSWHYWAESVATPNRTFHAVKCKSYLQFRFAKLEVSPTQAYMGIDASPILTGNYYLQTSSISPFSLGEYGMKYGNQ